MPVLKIPGLGGLVTFPDDVDVSLYLEQGWEKVSGSATGTKTSDPAPAGDSATGLTPNAKPSEDWKLSDLVAYAKAHNIEIDGDARKKADVWKSIEDAGNS